MPESYAPATLRRIRQGLAVIVPEYVQALRDLAQLRQRVRKVFDSVDLLITPTRPVPAPTITKAERDLASDRDLESLRNNFPFDIYALPTLSLPCGFTSTGLPIGLQIAGPHSGEARLLQVAHAYEHATEWHLRRPALDL
jgi:aspartyl-tRNA(Asn)/glutamyl-tRNA(Gln) amidotransferase subunit A